MSSFSGLKERPNLTGGDIKAAYEAEPNTNGFTDVEKQKLKRVTVSDVAEMAAINDLSDGQICIVLPDDAYRYDAASAAVSDGVIVVTATGMGAGRLIATSTTFSDKAELIADIRPSFPTGTLLDAASVQYEVAAPGAIDQDDTTAGGVKLYEAGPKFSTLARLQAAVARGFTVPDGQLVWAAGVPYIGDAASADPASGIARFFDPDYLRLASAEYVSPTWFGFATGASAATNAAAFEAALADGRKVVLPRGNFLCAPVNHSVGTPGDVVIEGAGANATVLDFGAGAGIDIVITGAADQMQGDKVSVDVSGIGFRTSSLGTQTALRIDMPDAGTGETGTHVLRSIKNLSFAGSDTAGYWANCVHITNGSYWNIDGCWGRGPESDKGGTFVLIDGGMSSVDTHINRIKGANFAEGIVCTGRNEGLTVRDAILVNVNTGIRHQPTLIAGETDQPWLHVSGGHINASVIGIDADDVTQIIAKDVLIYLNASNAMGMLVRRRDAVSGVGSHQITVQVASLVAAADQVGIQMDAYTGQSIISGCRFNSLKNAVVLLAGSNQNIGGDNLATNMAAASLVDLGTANAVSVTAF